MAARDATSQSTPNRQEQQGKRRRGRAVGHASWTLLRARPCPNLRSRTLAVVCVAAVALLATGCLRQEEAESDKPTEATPAAAAAQRAAGGVPLEERSESEHTSSEAEPATRIEVEALHKEELDVARRLAGDLANNADALGLLGAVHLGHGRSGH